MSDTRPLPPSAEIAFGDLDMWRAEIADAATVLGVRAQMIADYAELRDDFGLSRALKLMTIELCHVLGLAGDLGAQKARMREREKSRAASAKVEEDAKCL